ncbi:phage major capsid protein [Ruminococcaceae bacterium OttesenSCG-928-A16]|nr:phage major capsid protein [Ruminococcaceae bacterium OttesenSCG-928-A16]
MKSLDVKTIDVRQQAESVVESLAGDSKDDAVKQFVAFAENLQQQLIEEAKQYGKTQDNAVLASRGIRQLTTDENEYFQKAIDAMKSQNPQQSLASLDVVLPETVIDRVFDDLRESHPLLSEISFQNTGALVKIITSNTTGVAGWGELCAEISDELGASFEAVELILKKLSAFVPVCSAMLDLGPVWLERYVRELLLEALAVGLEEAIVDGDGNNKPLGMTRALSGATDGVFPRKSPVVVNSLDPVSLGAVLNTLSIKPNGKRRAVNSLLMVVNPADYFTKVFPAVTPRATDGTYTQNALPFPTRVVQSAAVPEGFAVFGIGALYTMYMGSGQGGKIEYSDDYKFLEDFRYYKIKLYGNGRAKDENAFVYADISGLKPTNLKVEVVDAAVAEG